MFKKQNMPKWHLITQILEKSAVVSLRNIRWWN